MNERSTRGKTALFFDLDGTLIDPYLGVARSVAHAMNSLGRPFPPGHDYRAFFGLPIRQALGRLCSLDIELQERAVASYRERFSTIGLYENRVFPAVDAMLWRLRASSDLVVCTSKPRAYAERILTYFDLMGSFVAIYGADPGAGRGNKRELLGQLLRREGIAASGQS